MTSELPIKRSAHLMPLSRDHHHGLLLCWKIKTGFSKGLDPQRIKNYADWFFNVHLMPHFEAEEKYVFPVLGNENILVIQAIEEHRFLEGLFSDTANIEDSLKKIQSELEKHIRFEERILFGEIEKAASQKQLEEIEKYHKNEKFTENTDDEFWK